MIGKQSLLPRAALAESQWAEAMSSTKLIAPDNLFLFEISEKAVFFFESEFFFFFFCSLALDVTNQEHRTVIRAQDQRLPEPVERRLELRAEHVDQVRPLFFSVFFSRREVEREVRTRRNS